MKLFAKKALIISAAALLMIAMIAIGVYAATGAESKTDSHVASAVVGGKTLYYTDLATAISEADEGSTVTVLKQIAVSGNMTIAAEKKLTVSFSGSEESLFLFKDGAKLTINGNDNLSFNMESKYFGVLSTREKNDVASDKNIAIVLNKVNVTSGNNIFASSRGARYTLSLEITGGTYNAPGKFLINAQDPNSGGATKTISKMTITDSILNTGIISARNMAVTTAKLTNVKMYDAKNYMFMPYSTNVGEWNIEVDGGYYKLDGYRVLHSPDGVGFNFTAKNTIITSSANTSGVFYQKKGNLNLTFTDSKILHNSDGIIIGNGNAGAVTCTLNTSNAVIGKGAIDNNGQIVGEISELSKVFQFGSSYDVTMAGTWSNDVDLVKKAFNAGFVANVNGVFYNNATAAETAGASLIKTEVTVNGKTFAYYNSTNTSKDATAAMVGAEAKIGEKYYFTISDAVVAAGSAKTTINFGDGFAKSVTIENGASGDATAVEIGFFAKVGDMYYADLATAIAAASDGVVTVVGNGTTSSSCTISKDVTIKATGDYTVEYTGTDPLFVISGDAKLDITGCTFKLGSASFVKFDNATDQATAPKLTLNDVNVTTGNHVITAPITISVNPTINIVGGTINAVGKYLFYDNDASLTSGPSKNLIINLDGVTINGAIYQTRVTNITGLWKNLKVNIGTLAGATSAYNGGYVQNITIVGGSYESSKYYILYAPDNGIANFTVSNAKFTVNAAEAAVYFRAGRGYLSLDGCEITTQGNAITLGRTANDTTVGVAIKNTKITTGAEKPVFVCTTDTTKHHDYGFSFDKAELLEDAKKALGIESFATTAGGHSGGYGLAGLAMLVNNGDTDTNVITVNADLAVKHQVTNYVTNYYPNVEIARPIVITSSGKYKITSTVNTLFNLTDSGELTIIGDNGLTFDLGSGNLVCARNGASAKVTASNTTFTTTGVLIAVTDASDDKAELKVRFNNVDADVASVIGSWCNGTIDIIWNKGTINSSGYTFLSSGPSNIKIQANDLTVNSDSQIFRIASDATLEIAINGGKYTSTGSAFYMIDATTVKSIIIDGAELTVTGGGYSDSIIYFRSTKDTDYGPVVIKNSKLTATGAQANAVFLYNAGNYKNSDMDLTLINCTINTVDNCMESNGDPESDFSDSKANIVIVNSSLTSSEAGAIKLGAKEGSIDIYNSIINTATAPFAVEKIAMKLHNEASVTVDKVTVDADNKFTVGTEDIAIDAPNNKITSAAMNDTDAIALGMVAKVNDTYYSNADVAAADGAALLKSIIFVGEDLFTVYAATPVAGSVAQIGNTYYPTLDMALADAKDGDTIYVLADATQTAPVTVKGALNITSGNGGLYTVTVACDGAAFVLNDGAALNIYNINYDLPAGSNLADVAEDAKATIKIDANVEINWAADAGSADALINVKGEADVTVLGDIAIAEDKYIVAFAEDAKGAITWDKQLSSIRGGTSIPFATNENVTLDLQNFSSDAEADAFLRGMSDEYLAQAVADAYIKIFDTIKNLYENYMGYEDTGVLDQDQAIADLTYIADVIADVYDEAYAFGYDQAQKYGYIDLINEYLDKAILALDAADAWVLANNEYIRSAEFRDQYYASTANARATIEEIRALINTNEELDEETYEEALALLNSLVGNLEDVGEILLITLDDAASYIYEQLMIALDKATTAVKEFIQGEIDKAMAEFNSFIADYVEYLDKIFPGVGETINGWLEKYPEMLLGLISKYDFKTDNFGDNAFNGDYEVNEDSFFLAIGDSSIYAELLAKKLGIYDTQIDLTDWNLIDPEKVAKADLITIGYNTNRLNAFAVEQMLGFVADFVDGDLRASVTEYAKLAATQLLNSINIFLDEEEEKMVADVNLAVNAAISEILANELIAGKTASDLDWAALVGEENVAYIDEAREFIKAKLIEEGVVETFAYTFDVVELVYDYLQTSDNAVLNGLDINKVREHLGEYTTYTVEIPVVDAIVYSAESYLYGYVQFNAMYAQTILSIKELNQDALIVLLSNYNPINDLTITLGDVTVEIGDIYETIAATTSAHSLAYALCLNDVVFVDISDAETVFDAYVAEGAASYDFVEFIQAYLADDSITDISEAGGNYIYEQILNAITITCGHVYDDDKDVDCNYCGEIRDLGTHECVDEDKDHKCDACGEIISECADEDKDHKCDTCGAILGACTDADRDHKCDVCGKTLTTCEDTNRDHRCEICNVRISNCVDMNTDHRCDICGAKLSSCRDQDNDHKCDFCDATLSECVDEDKDHKCDICGEAASKCVDVDKDHKCDICGAVLNDCVDANKDHKCDICEKVLGECADENKDHKCDVCDKVLSECADANKDHKCDVCDKVLSECADANKDHKCDVCDKALTECADADKNHKCDVCDKVLSECADTDKDHKCDYCGKEGITEHDYADATCDTAKTCKICGATEGDALGHKYDNACDADCNTCGATRTPAAHTYGDWVVTKEATATEDGERQRTCECGHVEKEVIPATGEQSGEQPGDDKDGLSGGALAAIIIGAVLVLAAGAFVVVRVVLKKKKA